MRGGGSGAASRDRTAIPPGGSVVRLFDGGFGYTLRVQKHVVHVRTSLYVRGEHFAQEQDQAKP